MKQNDELLPCPYCGEGETVIRENTFWTGMRSEITSVEVTHWCKKNPMQSFLILKGRTREDAIAAWNTRHTPFDTTTQYNPADYGDKVSGLSMDATVQESLTVQKEEALQIIQYLSGSYWDENPSDIYARQQYEKLRKYIEENWDER